MHPHNKHAGSYNRSFGKAALWIVLLLLLLAGGAWYYFNSGAMRIHISKAQILERLEEKLPVTRTWLYIFKITFDSPRVELTESSERIRAGLDLAIEISLLNEPEPLRGKLDAAAGIRFSQPKGAFYLEEPVIENLELEGLPEELAERTRDVLSQGVARYFESQPVYQLTERQSHRAARSVLQEVRIGDDQLTLILGPADDARQLLP